MQPVSTSKAGQAASSPGPFHLSESRHYACISCESLLHVLYTVTVACGCLAEAHALIEVVVFAAADYIITCLVTDYLRSF